MFDVKVNAELDYKNEKLIDAKIKSVANHYASRKGREDAQLVLIACCRHAVAHNDCSKLTKFWFALPGNAPHKMIKAWLEAFTTFSLRKDKAGNLKFIGRDADGKVAYLFNTNGIEVAFWDFKAASVKNKKWDVIAKLETLLKTANKRVKEGKETDVIRVNFIQRLDKMSADLLVTIKAEAEAKAKAEAVAVPAKDNVVNMEEAA